MVYRLRLQVNHEILDDFEEAPLRSLSAEISVPLVNVTTAYPPQNHSTHCH